MCCLGASGLALVLHPCPYQHRPSRPMFRPTNPLLGAAPAPGRSRPKGGDMPRRYETVYIFDSALDEPAITEKLEKFHALLTKEGKGTVSNVAHWGKRTLAFPDRKSTRLNSSHSQISY